MIPKGWLHSKKFHSRNRKTRVRSLNFVQEGEFFEPYDSFRYSFTDRSDDDRVIYDNLASLGSAFEEAWMRILLVDAFFMNTDRHMRNLRVQHGPDGNRMGRSLSGERSNREG